MVQVNQKSIAIAEFQTPRNALEACRYPRMASYSRRFIEASALITAPIIELFKKDGQFSWAEHQELVFRAINQKLRTKPILAHYNSTAPY